MSDHYYKKKVTVEPSDIAIGAGLAGTGYLGYKTGFSPREFLPMLKPKILVQGGHAPYEKGKIGGSSFSAIAHSTTRALEDLNEYKVNHLPAHKKLRDYLKVMNSDAIINVGENYEPIHRKYILNNKLNYRMLTDYGTGNLREPVEEIQKGMKTTMRIPEPHKYERLLVPGLEYEEYFPNNLGKKEVIDIGNIPTESTFENLKFNRTPNKTKSAIFSTGGGFGAPHVFSGDFFESGKFKAFDDAGEIKPNILDDILTNLKNKYGDDYKLRWAIDKNRMFQDTTPEHAEMHKMVQKIDQDIQAGNPRWKNLELGYFDNRKEYLNALGNADYNFMLPGSTNAELAALSGSPKKIINLVPNEYVVDWMPGHFSSNAAVTDKILPNSYTLNVSTQNRAKLLRKLMNRPSTDIERAGYGSKLKEAMKVIEGDIKARKMSNVKKLSIPLGLLIAGGTAKYLSNSNS
jgi:hypothetical protein